ncbi:MAG: MaoC/PaaZ C-terminal domain-containing protein [Haloarculaceae archaeon]
MTEPANGDTHARVRTFEPADVDTFATVTGDDQSRHTEADESGRRLVQGLLTGSMLTEIGGDLEMLARSIEYHFLRPVYTGDTVRCVWENEGVEERPDGWEVTARVTFERLDGDGETDESGTAAESNEEAERVIEATVEGVIEE